MAEPARSARRTTTHAVLPRQRGMRWTAALLLASTGALAADQSGAPPPRAEPHLGIELSASPAAVAVGDQLTVTVVYRWPHGWTVDRPDHEPDPAGAFSDEFVTSFPPAQRASSAEEERRTFSLQLAARHSGTWSLPRPSVSLIGPQGRRELSAPAVIIQVGTEARPADLPAPRPAWVRPLAASTGRTWLWPALLAGTLAALLILLNLWRRRTSAPPPTPFAVFAQDLAAAASTGDGKEAGARLSLALRRYVGSIHSFDGPGSTTRETAMILRGRLPDGEYRDLVRLLDQLDALRWSPADLPISALRPSVESARSWCDGVQQRLDAEAAERLAQRGATDSPVTTQAGGRT